MNDTYQNAQEVIDEINRQKKARQYQPCLHDGCPECHGKGVKNDGTRCVHWISCPCPKCSPRC